MDEYGLFNDESADWSAEEAVEAGFYSREEAEAALRERYSEEDELTVHVVEEPDEEEEEEDEEEDEEQLADAAIETSDPAPRVPTLTRKWKRTDGKQDKRIRG